MLRLSVCLSQGGMVPKWLKQHHTIPKELVSYLEFNVPFQHKYGYIRDKRSGVESYPYPVKESQQHINLNPGLLFVQLPPKRERDQKAHLNYYASTYYSWKQLSHHKTKLNQIQQNTTINLN